MISCPAAETKQQSANLEIWLSQMKGSSNRLSLEQSIKNTRVTVAKRWFANPGWGHCCFQNIWGHTLATNPATEKEKAPMHSRGTTSAVEPGGTASAVEPGGTASAVEPGGQHQLWSQGGQHQLWSQGGQHQLWSQGDNISCGARGDSISCGARGNNKCKKCPSCRGEHIQSRNQCPAHGSECKSCGKANHWAGVCHSKPQREICTVRNVADIEKIPEDTRGL